MTLAVKDAQKFLFKISFFLKFDCQRSIFINLFLEGGVQMKKIGLVVGLVIIMAVGCGAKYDKYKASQANGSSVSQTATVTTPQVVAAQPSLAAQQPVYTGTSTVTDYVKTQPFNDASKGQNVAGKLCWVGDRWERQVMIYNGMPEPPKSHPVWQYVATLPNPGRVGSQQWEPMYYKLFDQAGNVISSGGGTYYSMGQLTQPAPQVAAMPQQPPAPIVVAPAAPVIIAPAPVYRHRTYAKARYPHTYSDCARKLKEMGYECSSTSSIMQFQRDHGLRVDGKLGPETCGTVNAVYAGKKCNPGPTASAAANPKARAIERR